MKNNITFDSQLSDNEKRSVWEARYLDEHRKEQKVCVYAKDSDDFFNQFRRLIGLEVPILDIKILTKAEYEEEIA